MIQQPVALGKGLRLLRHEVPEQKRRAHSGRPLKMGCHQRVASRGGPALSFPTLCPDGAT